MRTREVAGESVPLWSHAQQRVLWVIALLLLALTTARLINSVHDKPDFRALGDDPSLDLRLDLNQATEDELEALPGIGVALASRIADFRKRHGPFERLSSLTDVPGIGEKRLHAIIPYLMVQNSGKSKVSVKDVIGRR